MKGLLRTVPTNTVLILLLRIRSTHLEILGFPMGGGGGVVITTGVFLRRLKLCKESRT